jgi:hypothetical protein
MESVYRFLNLCPRQGFGPIPKQAKAAKRQSADNNKVSVRSRLTNHNYQHALSVIPAYRRQVRNQWLVFSFDDRSVGLFDLEFGKAAEGT